MKLDRKMLYRAKKEICLFVKKGETRDWGPVRIKGGNKRLGPKAQNAKEGIWRHISGSPHTLPPTSALSERKLNGQV
jgi:hypothetical protein